MKMRPCPDCGGEGGYHLSGDGWKARPGEILPMGPWVTCGLCEGDTVMGLIRLTDNELNDAAQDRDDSERD